MDIDYFFSQFYTLNSVSARRKKKEHPGAERLSGRDIRAQS